MTRPRSPDYDSIQASIIKQAAGLFANRGYAATSIGDIAAACDCSKSRLYHYFESKEAILVFMLTEHVDKLLAGCDDILSGREDEIARFQKLIRFFLQIYSVSRDKHVVMLTCMEFLPNNVRKDVIKKQRQLISIVTDMLAKIRPERAKDEASAHVDAMLFFGMINWTYTWFKPDGRMMPTDLADRCVSLFLDGYRNSRVF
ncbi:TetR/AcrR family transcriptional regulator [Bradyrhizobium neotropicale]|uniref:TetR/AcrR family transcriptional regulator n=1 Tax=Bradyrhizobium neotropicale TaxID=1497615 RepID=UPI001AD78A16|nr:TetR/AcrR family transcriptional regulator [Bradyrhizobium neotropicale]MBO4221731.1 TetR family transcriptional regulator [Bradyrhizobium neotropicale]